MKLFLEEELNFYRICRINDCVNDGLRTIFKQEWDRCYGAIRGKWNDVPKNGMDFENGESPRNRKLNAQHLIVMRNGNTKEWDCTKLCYAILCSDCLRGLNPTVRRHVNDLRLLRNERFAHVPRGQIKDTEFKKAVKDYTTAFQGLRLPTNEIQSISEQKSFPTKEVKRLQLRNWLLTFFALVVVILSVWLYPISTSTPSFIYLSPEPSHDVTYRSGIVSEIISHLHELNITNNSNLTTIYTSGNPGSGKTQLARQIGEQFYKELTKDKNVFSFVMTLNAENLETLLESYADFARRLQCTEGIITNIITSKELRTDVKIRHLRSLISSKVQVYKSWLLVVDNVVNLTSTQVLLPQPGNEEWVGGQLLITTQDSSSIPPNSSSITHISISKGMEPKECFHLLASVSGITEDKMDETVAKMLDYQPLALASAASYVHQVRTKVDPDFGWHKYLQKLEEGKRRLTEEIFLKTNAIYPLTMTAATLLAVEMASTTEPVLDDFFQFLSFCSPEPLPVDVVTNYILHKNENQDSDQLRVIILSSSLIIREQQDERVFIRIHNVVHDVIQSFVNNKKNKHSVKIVGLAAMSFAQYVDERSKPWEKIEYGTEGKHLAPHVKTFHSFLKNRFSNTETLYPVVKDETMIVPNSFHLLGRILRGRGEFLISKDFLGTALKLTTGVIGPEHVDVANSHCTLGAVYRDLGDLQQAKQNIERSLAIRLKQLGPEHVDIATSYNNLGVVYHDLGDLQQANRIMNVLLPSN